MLLEVSTSKMPIEKELESLVLGRKKTVNQLASQSWGADSLLRSPETPRLDPDRPGLTGSQLVQLLLANAKVAFEKLG
jgi:hypothetical protein